MIRGVLLWPGLLQAAPLSRNAARKIPFSRPRRVAIRLREARENKLFVTEGDLAPLYPRMTITLSEREAGETGITWRMESRSKKPMTRVLLPLARLKAILEGDGARSGNFRRP